MDYHIEREKGRIKFPWLLIDNFAKFIIIYNYRILKQKEELKAAKEKREKDKINEEKITQEEEKVIELLQSFLISKL